MRYLCPSKALALPLVVFAAVLISAVPAAAQTNDAPAGGTTVSVDDLACMPVETHSVVTARVEGQPAGSTVRYYFRRLHEEVEDFYYVEMKPLGNGVYWAVLPKPEDESLDVEELERELMGERDAEAQRIIDELGPEADDNPQAAWWVVKERTDPRDPNVDLNADIIRERASVGKRQRRDWMLEMSLTALQAWLDDLEFEPSEHYATVVDVDGNEIARSPMRVARVVERDECDGALVGVHVEPLFMGLIGWDRMQEEQRREWADRIAGQADNIVVGETAPWEIGRRVFHWLCDGIVSRLDYRYVLRADDICRACVVAWLRKPELLVPAAAGVVGIVSVVPEREPVSPSEP